MDRLAHARIAILGTGWLGMALLERLVETGVEEVRGSYRRAEVRDRIEAVGATAVEVSTPERIEGLAPLLKDATALIVALPPGGRRLGEEATARYLAALKPLRPYLSDLRVIFTSSTGVYGTRVRARVTEATPPAPDTHSSRAVVEAERWLTDHAPRLTLLRLAGLFGPGRDPANFFGRTGTVPAADAPVNMLHRHDAVSAIEFVLAGDHRGTFNVCADSHPTKRAFYGRAVAHTELTLEFIPGGTDGKIVDSSALRRLGWRPVFDDPPSALPII